MTAAAKVLADAAGVGRPVAADRGLIGLVLFVLGEDDAALDPLQLHGEGGQVVQIVVGGADLVEPATVQPGTAHLAIVDPIWDDNRGIFATNIGQCESVSLKEMALSKMVDILKLIIYTNNK